MEEVVFSLALLVLGFSLGSLWELRRADGIVKRASSLLDEATRLANEARDINERIKLRQQ